MAPGRSGENKAAAASCLPALASSDPSGTVGASYLGQAREQEHVLFFVMTQAFQGKPRRCSGRAAASQDKSFGSDPVASPVSVFSE